ncbi:response regulator [Alkalimarinus alittae]|uniref:Response regulator n=1 Tax=Alkalimarinus alittae TaxID=2961619 RepID=A0ABY6N5X3_9ALTE|nr:response regulator [Alkalimarinus alittae]UZE97410.1 response regulator [Alkalimarinus alittae]
MSHKTALVVDDSSTARLLLSKVLRNIGIECRDAVSGEDALKQLGSFKPDFIFLDHIMPGIDGFETLKAIKLNPKTKSIPVVMYTSQNAVQYYKDAHNFGAAGVISKQIDREKLYLMLDRLCINNTHEDEISRLELSSSANGDNKTDNSQDKIRKLTGRLSTVETAYEELAEEFRQFKHDITSNKYVIDKRSQRPFFSGSRISTIAITVALFVSISAWVEISHVESIINSFDGRIGVMQSLIQEIIDLLN